MRVLKAFTVSSTGTPFITCDFALYDTYINSPRRFLQYDLVLVKSQHPHSLRLQIASHSLRLQIAISSLTETAKICKNTCTHKKIVKLKIES
jgi:hypothetical protein